MAAESRACTELRRLRTNRPIAATNIEQEQLERGRTGRVCAAVDKTAVALGAFTNVTHAKLRNSLQMLA